MHRSRLGVVLIDHAEGHDEAVRFWTGALGREPQPSEDEPEYTSFGEVSGIGLAVQRLRAGTPSRVHLDFETDDVRAEVARLENLGATVVDDRDEHAICHDPGGVTFCVVPVQNAERFEAEAHAWD